MAAARGPRTVDASLQESSLDGRRLRAAKNRDAVVTAVLQIIRERNGTPLPGAAEVAKRAKVSERTVFRHFADLDSLFFAAASQQRPVVAAALRPRPDSPELDRRIATICRLRSRLYEEVAPVRRVATRLATDNKTLASMMEEAHAASRVQLAETFQPELGRATGARRSLLLDELDALTTWRMWEILRTQQGLTVERSRKVVADLMSILLKPLEVAPNRRR